MDDRIIRKKKRDDRIVGETIKKDKKKKWMKCL